MEQKQPISHSVATLPSNPPARSGGSSREALDSCQTIKISLKDIESIDLSCIQIFCAAHKTAFKADKRLTLDAALPEAAALAIEQAGFDCLKDCGNNENACPVMRRTDG